MCWVFLLEWEARVAKGNYDMQLEAERLTYKLPAPSFFFSFRMSSNFQKFKQNQQKRRQRREEQKRNRQEKLLKKEENKMASFLNGIGIQPGQKITIKPRQ